MNCLEFERVLPEFLEGVHTSGRAGAFGLMSCVFRSVADLNLFPHKRKLLRFG